jgi:catechol 2,3-dioxygenase-like lactoylglutathione lyase family enzyme
LATTTRFYYATRGEGQPWTPWLHQAGKEFEPKANKPTAGSADLCFITDSPLNDVMEHLRSCGVEIIEEPVKKTGAIGAIESVYFRDLDLNLIEASVYL